MWLLRLPEAESAEAETESLVGLERRERRV